MRRTRRGSLIGAEFPSSGEDSFVAVVVTKLTGALLFILLMTMVIMALLPKAVDSPVRPAESPVAKLQIDTAGPLPEAIVGRPYRLALAASNAPGALHWRVSGELPEGLTLDSRSGRLEGTPTKPTTGPIALTLLASGGGQTATSEVRLSVYRPATPLMLASTWAPKLPPIPVSSWLERGFGFLLLVLLHLVGMNTLRNLEARSVASDGPAGTSSPRRRFLVYRSILRTGTAVAVGSLAVWLARPDWF